MKNELINGKTLKEVVARYVETSDVKGFADFFWAREYDNQSHKQRLIKEVGDLDVSTMTYGAFRRKVLEIISKLNIEIK